MKKQTKTPKAPKLPKLIYVVRETDGDDNSWLEADEATEGFGDGALVGEYELVGVMKKRITHKLVGPNE